MSVKPFIFQKYLPEIYLFSLVTLIFLPSLTYQFTYDDIGLVIMNPYISKNLNIWEILQVFALPTNPGDLYRPLTMLSIKLNFLISGMNPISYHISNIILHGIATLTVYKFILTISKNYRLAFVSTMIFLVHPIHIEAIANIYNRSEILVCVFGLLGLINFYQLLEKPTLIRNLLFGLFLFLAFLAKESAITLVGICPIIYLIFLKQQGQPAKRTLITSFTILVIIVGSYILLRKLTLDHNFLTKAPHSTYLVENPLFHLNLSSRLVPAIYLLGEYLRLIILPLSLSADYSLPYKYFTDILSSWPGYSAMLLASIFLGLVAFNTYKKKDLAFWGFWFLITFSLTINLLVPIGTFMADRLAYTPSIGLIVIIVSFLLKIPKHRTLVLTIYFVVLLVHTNLRLPIWKNNISLFHQTMIDNSASPKAPFNLGNEFQLIEEYEKSIIFYKEALFRDPSFIVASQKMIYSYLMAGNWRGFEYWTNKYLALNPEDPIINDLVQKYYLAKQGQVPLLENHNVTKEDSDKD